jgi:RND family efflux transporter MFP subunit
MSQSKPSLEDLRIHRPDPKESPHRASLAAVGVILLVLAAVAGWWFSRTSAIEVTTTLARAVTTGGGDRTVLNASGYVTARRQATVSSKVTGKVIEVDIEEGMKVKEGQVLARLDDTNVKTSLDVAQAQLASAHTALEETRAQLKSADLEYRREIELARQKIASESDLDTAEASAKALGAHLAMLERDEVVAEKQVALWQQQMDDMIIRAPFDGVVTTKDSQPGEMISPVSAGGGFTRTGIGTIVDMKSLEIEIDVNESYINRVEPAQPVLATLDAYPEWKIPCKVIAIIPTADRQKSTVKVRVGFDQLDPRILPEMSAKVAFRETGAEAASVRHSVIIPKNALRNQEGRDIVFVARDGRAERRAVSVSNTEGGEATLNSGLESGETIIVDAPPDLKDGAKVKPAKR